MTWQIDIDIGVYQARPGVLEAVADLSLPALFLQWVRRSHSPSGLPVAQEPGRPGRHPWRRRTIGSDSSGGAAHPLCMLYKGWAAVFGTIDDRRPGAGC